jgi:Na+-translocating ferredoxin:NAD+ oxidoreductase RnfC subunit
MELTSAANNGKKLGKGKDSKVPRPKASSKGASARAGVVAAVWHGASCCHCGKCLLVCAAKISELEKLVQEKRQRQQAREEESKRLKKKEKDYIKKLQEELDAESPCKAAKKRHSCSASSSDNSAAASPEVRAATWMAKQRPLVSAATLEWHYQNIALAAKYNVMTGSSLQQLQVEAHSSAAYAPKARPSKKRRSD